VSDWPTALEVAFDPATRIEPRCPTVCCFRVLCPEHQQRAALAEVFARSLSYRDCPRFARMEELLYRTTGCRPPATSEALLEVLAEKIGMREPEEERAAELARLEARANALWAAKIATQMEAMRARFRERERVRRETQTGQSELTLDHAEGCDA
jgi:hypothetical protein